MSIETRVLSYIHKMCCFDLWIGLLLLLQPFIGSDR